MQSWKVILCFIASMIKAYQGSTLEYCYKDDSCNPYAWGKYFESCIPDHTKLHSPIDLSDSVVKKDVIQPLQLRGFDLVQNSWNVTNDGHSVVVQFKEGMSVNGGGLKCNYSLLEMRFHWGSNITNGSEHTLKTQRFPMEMQIVALSPGFTEVMAASQEVLGLAMMGVFIDIVDDENKHFQAISDAIVKVSHPGDSVNVAPPALLQLMPDTKYFYHYQGGQTTPPCLQTVSWIVFEKPIYISRHQYQRFATGVYYTYKNDSDPKVLTENYRPIQSRLMHQIFASAAVKSRSASGASQSQHAPFISLLLSLLPFIIGMT